MLMQQRDDIVEARDDLQWKMSSLNDISMACMCEGLQPIVRY